MKLILIDYDVYYPWQPETVDSFLSDLKGGWLRSSESLAAQTESKPVYIFSRKYKIYKLLFPKAKSKSFKKDIQIECERLVKLNKDQFDLNYQKLSGLTVNIVNEHIKKYRIYDKSNGQHNMGIYETTIEYGTISTMGNISYHDHYYFYQEGQC